MVNEKKTKITAAGLQKLQEDLDHRIGVMRNEIAKEIEFARSYGDLSEHAEYTEAKNKQAANENEIARLQYAINHSEVVNEDQISTQNVSLGTTVKLYDKDMDEVVAYDIVGTDEADPFNNKISNESPIGKALINAARGEEVEVELPMGGTATFKVLNIKHSDAAEYTEEDA